ncbi:hypothetical protein PUN28_018162 [Cardiocondyla obscurior]|uniref:Uncharacterized protein n=1 Tax=Cardiocondyla obscurior TaxID=286306 RepID=A0AAW2EIE6_9HYME
MLIRLSRRERKRKKERESKREIKCPKRKTKGEIITRGFSDPRGHSLATERTGLLNVIARVNDDLGLGNARRKGIRCCPALIRRKAREADFTT